MIKSKAIVWLKAKQTSQYTLKNVENIKFQTMGHGTISPFSAELPPTVSVAHSLETWNERKSYLIQFINTSFLPHFRQQESGSDRKTAQLTMIWSHLPRIRNLAKTEGPPVACGDEPDDGFSVRGWNWYKCHQWEQGLTGQGLYCLN